MEHIATLLALLPVAALAQVTHPVDVGGSLSPGAADPYYAPQTLTIDVGDIVQWNWSTGTHNVTGTQEEFPDNPEGFSSGENSFEAPHTYSHTFTIPGVYDYHCTVEFQGQSHATTQFGTITVVDPNGIRTEATNKAIKLYPVPANDLLMLSLKGCTGVRSVDILNANGALVRNLAVQDDRVNSLDLSGLPAGQYYLMLDRIRRTVIKPFVKL
ncbi:MAG TPA: plastocyanin/azurin family copper-binding protein [Flavobacteriales bacterium]|nr:plastocyanin/azurin family copper-binding protein [Flavobacteriales bacterium]